MQSSLMKEVIVLVVVGALWGVTNPLLKKASGHANFDPSRYSSLLLRLKANFIHLVSNWRSVGPFLLNQCGSLLFYLTLSSADLSLAVPIANSLAFCFTAVTGWYIGESVEEKSLKNKAGLVLMLFGITLCTVAKS